MNLTIPKPDDWHLHLRDGERLASVVAHTAAHFARAIIMPNLTPPVTTAAAALAYRDRIMAALPESSEFTPLMTIYLTDRSDAACISAAHAAGVVAAKLYPAGATTNSDSGVTDVRHLDSALAAMSELGMPLLVHGEVTGHDVDVFVREQQFLEEVFTPLLRRFGKLRAVLEHVTSQEGVEFVRRHAPRVAGTLTPQHLIYNRNALFEGGLRPHRYCLPILKRESDRRALVAAATDGEGAFFIGTDSAPHGRRDKENACGCAGMYTAPTALSLYAQLFEENDALEHLEGFLSRHGPAFYGLPVNAELVTLEKTSWQVPEHYSFGDDTIIPCAAGRTLPWSVRAGRGSASA